MRISLCLYLPPSHLPPRPPPRAAQQPSRGLIYYRLGRSLSHPLHVAAILKDSRARGRSLAPRSPLARPSLAGPSALPKLERTLPRSKIPLELYIEQGWVSAHFDAGSPAPFASREPLSRPRVTHAYIYVYVIRTSAFHPPFLSAVRFSNGA
jgi:hypothetical protein